MMMMNMMMFIMISQALFTQDFHHILFGLLLSNLVGLLGAVRGARRVDRVGRRALLLRGAAGICLLWLAAVLCVQHGAYDAARGEAHGRLKFS
jgi:hypothetical protein